MPEPVGARTTRLTNELREQVAALIENTELVDVRPIRMTAELDDDLSPDAVVETTFSVVFAFASGPGSFRNKFDFAFDLLDAAGEAIGAVSFSLVVEYAVGDADYEPTEEAADFFAGTTGYLAAFPYARELFQSLTSRMQFDPLVLGLLRRGTHEPRTITSHRRAPV